jgi:hypothetical protein
MIRVMKWILDRLAAFVATLCAWCQVPMENVDDGRPGNLPPPEGGISSLGPGRL